MLPNTALITKEQRRIIRKEWKENLPKHGKAGAFDIRVGNHLGLTRRQISLVRSNMGLVLYTLSAGLTKGQLEMIKREWDVRKPGHGEVDDFNKLMSNRTGICPSTIGYARGKLGCVLRNRDIVNSNKVEVKKLPVKKGPTTRKHNQFSLDFDNLNKHEYVINIKNVETENVEKVGDTIKLATAQLSNYIKTIQKDIKISND